jgi:PrtD family type I secretion system ABC transporter
MEQARNHAIGALSLADQLFAKIEIIHALGMRTTLTDRWMRHRARAVADHVRASDRLAVISAISRSSRMLAQSGTLGAGAYLALQGEISAGAIIAASVLVGRALAPIEASIGAWQDLQKAWAAYNRLVHFLPEDALSPVPAVPLICRGRLSVENLSFSAGNHLILRDISFEVKPGEMIAVVGVSGSGKTTLIRHLVGAWPASHGSARLDNLEVSKMNDDMRQRHLGYVPQDIQLLDGTIVDNISRFGTPIPEDIVAAAQLAGVHDMILRMPENYGTHIGIDGMLLSAGQRQQLALARALYGNPVFVALDEPCAHLDELSERMLMQTLAILRERGVTVCIASHKPNLIRLADLVLVLNAQGHARLGTPDDLFRPALRPVTTDGRRIAS